MKRASTVRWWTVDDDLWVHIVATDEMGEDIAELSLTREQLLAMLAAIKPPLVYRERGAPSADSPK